METIRVLIVADDPLARAGLAALLVNHPTDQADCVIVGQVAAPGDRAGEFARDLDIYRPDVLLWDLGWDVDPGSLPEFNDLDLPVIALLPDASLAADCQAVGARGILRRDVSPDRMIAAVVAVVAGLIVLDPAFAEIHQAGFSSHHLPDIDLTPRELDVLRLLAEGLANRAIAVQLDISEHTVKFHLNAILSKLGAQSRTEAVVTAIRLGLIAV